jgi:chloride channel 7
MDFEEMESVMWRKHQLRRFFQDRGHWWTASRRSTSWKWTLVIWLGIFIGIMGFVVALATDALFKAKFNATFYFINSGQWTKSFFTFTFINLLYSLLAGICCCIEPTAAGSGIPEIKAYLNGINLNKVVRIRVLYAKVVGVCFSVAAGLACGKEGPMIHAGAILGAAVSQGRSFALGIDTTWTKFQDLRNDRSKRDFVTFGAAAGVAAAFAAPIGGILFTLEEGASFWSTTLTFRAFFCAMVTQLVLNLFRSGYQLGNPKAKDAGLFAFGVFDTFTGYYTYELFIFLLMGAVGGIMGAYFNHINEHTSILRMKHINPFVWKRIVELLSITFSMGVICFVTPLIWGICTPIPVNTADWSSQQIDLLADLVQYQCNDNEYNQVASLYMAPADVAMQQLFHFKEEGGTNYATFDTGALLMFLIPYFFMAAITSGILCPAGLFVPTLLAGAAYGRIVGHILNSAFGGYVTDSGTYALIGASAMLGGMSRMTIAGTIIVLEASGNTQYLLPLMLTFAGARYAGNAINLSMYDMQIELKELPFLEGSLKTLGLLNYHPIDEVMAQPVVTLNEITRISLVHHILSTRTHNGFPVVKKNGHLCGFILRKTLCNIIKLKAFSSPIPTPSKDGSYSAAGTPDPSVGGSVKLAPAATVFHDTLERTYPNYPDIKDIHLDSAEMNCWLDVRPYMDTAPYAIHSSSSVSRCYRFFRTLGLRHLIVLDGDHRVTGIITRKDLTESRLEHHWFHEGDNMQKFINVDPAALEPAHVYESTGLLNHNSRNQSSDDISLVGSPGAQPFEVTQSQPFSPGARDHSASSSVGSSSGGSRHAPVDISSSRPSVQGRAAEGLSPPKIPKFSQDLSALKRDKQTKEPKSVR